MTKQFYFAFFALFLGVLVQAQNTTTGSVFFYDFEPIPDVIMNVNGQTATTDANGNYEINWADASEAYLVGSKTADYSTGINMLDVVAMRNHILAITTLETTQLVAADVNASGGVTAFDMIMVLRHILGLEVNFTTDFPSLIFLPEECNASNNIFCGAYADLNTDNDNVQNFYGIKKGDVIQEEHFNTDIQPVFSLEQAGCNGAVNVNIIATDYDAEIGGFQFSLRWDATKFNFSNVNLSGNGPFTTGNFNYLATDEGMLTTAFFSNNMGSNEIESGDALFTLVLNPIGDYEGEAVVFDNVPTDMVVVTWTEELIETTFEDVTLSETLTGITEVNISVDNASTSNSTNGVIGVENVVGGVPPYDILLVETNTMGDTHINLPPGDYTLEITDATGCTWLEMVTVSSTVGLFDVFKNDWLMLSQNPITQGTAAQIQVLEMENKDVSLLIVNSLGQTIAQRKETITANAIIDLPAIRTAGMYWIIVENGEHLARLPLVVQ